MKPSHLLVSIAACFAFPFAAESTTYYVNNCGHDTNCNGQYAACWSSGVTNCAKKTIQAGMYIPGVVDGDKILVATGTYTGTGNWDLQFPRTSGVARAITVKCASCPENCTIDAGNALCNPGATIQHRGFWFDKDHATNNSVVEGFTIRNGCIQTGTNTYGGAILVDQSQPTIRGCIFEQNTASYGGGIAFVGDNGPTIFEPVLDNCTIKNNKTRSGGDGGGVYCLSDIDTMVKNCRINGNTASGVGGGMYWDPGSDPRIDNCIVEGNTAGNGGGGVFIGLFKDSPPNVIRGPYILRSRIGPNNSTTSSHGGGIRMDGSDAGVPKLWIENCTVIQNHADASFGGGVALTGPNTSGGSMTVNLVNSIIAGNTANSGGGLWVYQFTPTILTNVTMMHNTVPVGNGGSAIFFEGRSGSTVSNTILWYDVQPPAQAQVRLGGLSSNLLTVQRSDIQDTLPAGVLFNNNISPPLNPLFVDPDGYDNIATTIPDNNYHLQDESPCNDRGSVLLVPPDDLDLDGDGNPTQPIERVPFDREDRDRYVDDPPGPYLGVIDIPNGYTEYVDMGAYELGGCPTGTINVNVASPADGTRDARQPHPPLDNSLGVRQGIGSPNSYTCGPEPIDITLLNLVRGAGIVDCWQLCETGIEQVEGIPPLSANRITSVTEQTPGVYRFFLERPISAGHWTTIKYLGGSSYVTYASLPGDSSGNGTVNVTDLGGLRAYILYGGGPPPYGIYGWDLDHNGLAQQGDIDRWYDLYYGVSTFIPWGNASLPTNTCPGGGAGPSSALTWSESDALSSDEYRLFFEEFAIYLAGLIVATQADEERLWNLADAVIAWTSDDLSSKQLAEFASILGEALPTFVSPIAAEVGDAIVTGLKP